MDIQSPAFVDLLRGLTDAPEEMPYVAVCINDPTRAVRAALRIKRALPRLGIHVRLDSIVNAALFLKTVGQPDDETEIHPFGMLSEICSAAAIDNREQDRLARTIHDAYRRERAAEGKSDEATVPWEVLDHDRRDSNRRQADHIPVKIRAIGCEIGPADDRRCSQRVTGFTPEEVEILARVEHARWNAERFAAGWTLGEKVPGRRVSPYLVGYDDLDNSIQEYDRQTVRKIPAFLESAQLWVYRRESPASS